MDVAFEYGLDAVGVHAHRRTSAIPIGVCLGVWIRAKTKSPLSLLVYAVLAALFAAAFLPDSAMTQPRADFVGLAIVVLWFGGALIARHQIARYYMQREGQEFHLSLAYTLLFGVWYLNYRIWPEFPTDVTSGLPIARS